MEKDFKNLLKILEDKIDDLPSGYLTTKNIKGRDYTYYRYYLNNKRLEKYVNEEEKEKLSKQIKIRKELETQYKDLIKEIDEYQKHLNLISINSYLRIGEDLKRYVNPVKEFKKRKCYSKLQNYIYGNSEKVFVLFGLRRTGKTTLIRQIINEMDEETFSKTAFIQLSRKDNLKKLNKDIKILESLGFRYIFLDEVTVMEDFIEGAALFSDIYTSSGLKIVLSGTDSLGFIFATSDTLYDRAIMLHTTFISFKEFNEVLGINSIDEYIKYGGTMSFSGEIYNNDDQIEKYIDSAIAKNIQNSLKFYQYGNHFRSLKDLYIKNELTSVINRVVEDMNHRFTVEVLTKNFRSNDLSLTAKNIRNDKTAPSLILDEINENSFNEHYKDLLEILNKNEQTIEINEAHAIEIKEYLKLLDLIYETDVKSFPNINQTKKHVVVSQCGIRYAQAKKFIEALFLDEKFNTLNFSIKNEIISRALSTIMGKMMEDIVLLETKISNKDKDVFKLQFAVGEIDMVVFNKTNFTCEIYEIKHSKEKHKDQIKHLVDNSKLEIIENCFGKINRKCLIYRGESNINEEINYINVETYLKSL